MIGTVGRCLAQIFCFCALICVTVFAAPAHDLTQEQMSAIDHYVDAEMKREHVVGIAVGIYGRGQILLAKGYGLANIELNVPVKAETIFQSGSVGKQFTSAAIMMLVEEGKISLDDSIVKYFPNAPPSWQAIRVKNLLSHTSGLSEYETDERAGPTGPFYIRLDFTEDELVNKVEALPIEFKPGDKWDYRNTNYMLLGVIIHKVSGSFYADYLQQRVFTPLGMSSTRLISEADIVPNRSSGYETKGDKIQNQSWVSPTFNSTADGALYFNVLDLAKWDAALYGTKLLKQSSLDQTWTVFSLNDGKPNSANYGFGWEIASVNGQHKQLDHGGAWQGFRCHILRYPDDSVSVVVLANSDSASPEQFAHVIAGIVNPDLELPKLVAIEDKQPEVARRLGELLDQIAAGKDVRDQLSSKLAALFTPDVSEYVIRKVKPIWPSDKMTLVSRKESDGVVVSRYRIVKGNESRIVRFVLGTNGKVATIGFQPDPDVR